MDIIETLEIAISFGIVNRQSQEYFTKAAASIDLTFSEWFFLSNLYAHEGINQEDLSNFLLVDRAATARSVKTLEEKGLIARRPDESDKRVKRLYLTEKGKSYKLFILSAVKRWVEYVTLGIDEATIVESFKSLTQQAGRADFSKLLKEI
ncbi:MAG: MarR family transcriptional regulator [Pelosinus sp.]|nr:MarR family transcriptional regulator [Pelosinus sp.]